MHEFAIALNIVDLLAERFADRPGTRVVAVHLRLGPLSGVVAEALASAFEVAAAGTLADGARLVVDRPAVVARCDGCGREVRPEGFWLPACPGCGGPLTVVQGRELELVAVEVAGDGTVG